MAAKLWNTASVNAFSTTLNGSITDSDNTVILTTVVGLSYPGILVIDRQDANGVDTPTNREYISYTGITSNTLTGVVRGVAGSTAQTHSSGAIIEEVFSVSHWNDLVSFLNTEHDTAGKHDIAEMIAGGSVIDDDTFASATDTNVPTGESVKAYVDAGDFLTSSHYAPDGFLINGKIVPSVVNDDLVVAIKGMDGNDPSASNPVYVRIENVVRTITAALSVTCADGTNWFYSGSTEIAAKEVDYFVYLGYNATDGVVVGFSRIPFGRIYSDFSTTNTNDRFCAISTITNAAAGDNYVNIGRFAATLSATGTHDWTVPTFTSKNLIQFPIFTTRWLSWLPAFAGFSTPPTVTARYKINDRMINLTVNSTADGTSNANSFTMTGPIGAGPGQVFFSICAADKDNGALSTTRDYIQLNDGGQTLTLTKGNAATGWTTSGAKSAYFPFMYEL